MGLSSDDAMAEAGFKVHRTARGAIQRASVVLRGVGGVKASELAAELPYRPPVTLAPLAVPRGARTGAADQPPNHCPWGFCLAGQIEVSLG